MTAIAVIAKECVPGRVKTRLHPQFSLEEAAMIASAALSDTLRAVDLLAPTRRILYFDGAVPPADAVGWEVHPQSDGRLDERIADLFDAVEEPLLLLGMDTPHLDPASLVPVLSSWDSTDAWFGPATDGGFWALGMREPDGRLIRGVPMSTNATGLHQLSRLNAARMRVRILPPLTDIDTAADVPIAALRSRAVADVLTSIRPQEVVA